MKLLQKDSSLVVICTLLLSLIFLFSFSILAEDYTEAPELQQKVEDGDLPPLSERLPDNPFVVGPGVLKPAEHLEWKPGKFGGTLKTTHTSPEWDPYFFCMNNETLLSAPFISVNNIKGNILSEFKANEDNTVFTLKIRENLKWSDGHPVTTEDVKFTYEDILNNEELTPIFPAKFRIAGEPMELEIIDNYTFKITFAEPYGDFITKITDPWGSYAELIKPEHYLKNFHIKYTTMAKLEPYLEEEELEDEWWNLFNMKDIAHWDMCSDDAIGFPVLYPWMRAESSEGLLEFKRNPYYFKVDTEGQQLPYINNVKSFYVGSTETMTMNVLSGQATFLGGAGLQKMPLYKEKEEQGNFKVHLLKNHVNPLCLYMNYTYEDQVWQEVVKDIRFRKALSHSVNYQEIIDNLYFGLASSPVTIEAEYNPDKARELLNEMGLGEKDNQGFRLGPDGETFEFLIEVAPYPQIPEVIKAAELLVEYLKDVGLNASMKKRSTTLFGQKSAANELTASLLWLPVPTWRHRISMGSHIPEGKWGREWQTWYDTDGESGEAPPTWIKEVYDINERIIRTIPDEPEGKKAMQDLFDWYQEYIPFIPIVQQSTDVLITPDNLGNVAEDGMALGAVFPAEQYYFEE